MTRFKLDVNIRGAIDVWPVAVSLRRPRRFRRDAWEQVESFKTREDALAWYDKVKDLPEYLP